MGDSIYVLSLDWISFCHSLQCLQARQFGICLSLQQIHNCLARTVVKAPKSSLVTPILRPLHWLKITKRIEYKLLSLTYKVLTTSQPDYLHSVISVQSSVEPAPQLLSP